MAKPRSKTAKKIKKKNIAIGIAHIHSTHNNTIVTFSDQKGDAIAWSSAGAIGYKGSKKSTPYAAGLAAGAASEAAIAHGMKEVKVELKGMGPGKDAARKQIEVSGIKITEVKEVTPIPHNGTRPPVKVLRRLEKRK
ncbi:30S ribosomal protein S11 [Candidatus Mycoplasma mahonii]|uniref:30S ribosomal protein S11 n=1 Tax=Candidatus Mycoplasma mahonii TaxID=3004105 RepID=UPI0026EF43D6|nr:30S ribosomal protein S11 [Candidatus Mycoplasma mahonii]WKX02298.1 30S ribosomal protein S11 [Candidatus Mycoplasma mahonii]